MRISRKRLCKFMRDSRINAGLTLEFSAEVIGFSSKNHLWKCENEAVPFPPAKFKRAAELYGVTIADIVKVATDDFKETIEGLAKK